MERVLTFVIFQRILISDCVPFAIDVLEIAVVLGEDAADTKADSGGSVHVWHNTKDHMCLSAGYGWAQAPKASRCGVGRFGLARIGRAERRAQRGLSINIFSRRFAGRQNTRC